MHQSDFMAWLSGMLEKVDKKYLEPVSDAPVQSGEVVLGTISEANYRLLGLSLELSANAERLLHEKISFLCARGKALDGKTFKAEVAEVDEIVHKMNVVRELFWAAVRHEFNIYNADVGIRDGNTIVRVPDRTPDIADPLFGDIDTH